MKAGRTLACVVLLIVVGASLAAGWLAPALSRRLGSVR